MIATQPAAESLHEIVAAEIRAFMARRRLTQTTLARALGWKQQYLSRRLTGQVPLDLAELGQLAEVLDVAPESFFQSVETGINRSPIRSLQIWTRPLSWRNSSIALAA